MRPAGADDPRKNPGSVREPASPWRGDSRALPGGRDRPDGGCLEVRQSLSQLFARADVELREHLAQVVLDGARADEQPGTYLRVGLPFCGESSDLRLLGSEDLACRLGATAHGFAGGEQLAPGALGERLGPAASEHLVCAAQLGP